MNKRIIWILLLFIGLTIFSLIFIQVKWISNSISIKEQHFDQLVNNILSDLAIDIERQEADLNILGDLDPFSLDTGKIYFHSDYSFDTFLIDKDYWFKLQQEFHAHTLKSESIPVTGIDSMDTTVNDSLSGINMVEDKEFRKWIDQRRVMVNSILDKLFRFNPKIEERINPSSVQKYLLRTFHEKNIDLPFEYAITKWNTIPVFKSENFSLNEDNHTYKVKLFANDLYSERNFLFLYFPDKQNYLVGSLGFMAFSSVMLTLILIIGFILTIFIIIKQKKLSEIRNDFISNMTHELKTPISTISLASQMLNDKSIPTESKNIDYLSGIITEESKKLGFHVEKVLQLAIFEKGDLDLKLKMIDLHDIITNVIHSFSIQVKYKNGTIIPSLNAEKHIVYADSVHITNVISNLMDNAIKYTTRNPEIRISTFNENNSLILAVKDNGIGISKADLKKVFEKFYRVPTGNIHTIKGFGLGLSYVKKIVEEHKGNIKVESTPYEGTTFKIILPLNKI